MNRFQMVVFDMDGVLLDSEPLHAATILHMLEIRGITDYDPSVNVGKSSVKMFEALIAQYHLQDDPMQMVEEMTEYDISQMKVRQMQPSAGLLSLLEALSSHGVLIGLASSSPRRFVDAALEHLGIAKYFSYSAAGTEAPRQKPYPDLYEKVLSLSGIPAAKAAAVEDSSAGLRSAKAAGLYACGYENVTSGHQDLSAADCTVSAIADLLPVFFPDSL